jgi:MFS family permease
LKQYGEVWRIAGGPTLLGWGVVGRLGIGMTPLALLLLVQHSTGHYTPATVAAGAYALAGAVASPIVSRTADRIGPAPVLRVTAIAHPVTLVGLLFAVSTDTPIVVVWVISALAGATYPPLSVAIRGAWTSVTGPKSSFPHLRTVALGAETTMSETVYTLGPLLVGAFVAVGSAAIALGASAVVTFAGTLMVARGPAMRGWTSHPSHTRAQRWGPLQVPGFAALLTCTAGLCVSFGVVPVAVPGYATAHAGHGASALSGLLLGLWGLGSAVAGVWFGTRPQPVRIHTQFAWLMAYFALTLVVLAVMPTVPAFGVAILLGGTAVAPALTVEYSLVARLAPPSMVNESHAWLMAVAVTANAAGTAVTGPILDRWGGVPFAFLLAAALVAAAAVLSALPGGPLARGLERAGVEAGLVLEVAKHRNTNLIGRHRAKI